VKKLIAIVILACLVQRLSAQNLHLSKAASVDSLKQALHATTNDTLRMVLSSNIQLYYYYDNNWDSTLFYSEQFLQLAQKLHYRLDEAYAYDVLAIYMRSLVHPQTLETLLKAVRIAEDPKSEKHILPENYMKRMIYWREDFTALLAKNRLRPKLFRAVILGSVYNDLGSVYASTMYNEQKGFYYLYKAIDIYRAVQDSTDLGIAYHDIANYFASINQYDSGLYYAQKSLSILMSQKLELPNMALIGSMYYKKGNISAAFTYLRKCIENSPKYWLPYYTFAEYHLDNGNGDSSLYYAKKAFEGTKTPVAGQETSTLLAKVYGTIGKPDSAAKYYQLALSYNDIVNSIDKKRLLQAQDFEEQSRQQELEEAKNKTKVFSLLGGIGMLLLFAGMLLLNNRRRKRMNTLLQQKNQKIESTLEELKATQAQLIQSAKMASLGELTAGIAHEIQNPLNFVNNFSEVNNELIDELKNQKSRADSYLGNNEEQEAVLLDIYKNNEKIRQHGKRADAIVKGMLQHARASSGKKEPTNINKLADEYIRLSFHGLRAKDKNFNATIETHFDDTIKQVQVIPEDIGRVLLNLFNNAFYAVSERKAKLNGTFEPIVTVSTKNDGDNILITVQDNGTGIPQKALDKIFQPFYTTKPPGDGTGLGLSLSYDIITKGHGGELKVESKEGEGSTFVVQLPI
jgi:two-component system NtrC family sensor kinase